MKVHFKDTIAEVREFSYSLTYGGLIEGSRAEYSKVIMEQLTEDVKKFEGHMYFTAYRDEQKKELKDCRYYIFAETDVEHKIFITWFGDAMSDEMTVVEAVEKITREINFKENCRYISIDDMF